MAIRDGHKIFRGVGIEGIKHSAFQPRYTFQGPWRKLDAVALSRDGKFLASKSNDYKIRIWDTEIGQCIKIIDSQYFLVDCLTWSPDGKKLALSYSGWDGYKIIIWDMDFDGIRYRHILNGPIIHSSNISILSIDVNREILSIAWSKDGNILASSSVGEMIYLWDSKTGHLISALEGHADSVYSIVWSPHDNRLCSASYDNTIRIWDTRNGKEIRTLIGHQNRVTCVAWSPDGLWVASGSDDCTIRIWHPESGMQMQILEGHLEKVISVSFIDRGGLLCSHAEDGSVLLWRTDTWDQVPIDLEVEDLVTNPWLSIVVVVSKNNPRKINILDIDLSLLRDTKPIEPSIHYVNAKAVLLGESGVGKSGLGIRLAEGTFRPTESTHGAQFWHFPIKDVPKIIPNLQAELTLWDLAGQPEYRLIHQLFLDDTDVAILLFDCSDPNDPFWGVPYWAKVLKKHVPIHAVKFLVSARCDVSPVTVDRQQINNVLVQYGLHEYIKTSAKKGDGIDYLLKHLVESIPWERLPHTTTPRLFQVIRKFILEQKMQGNALLSLRVIQQEAAKTYTERNPTQSEINIVVALLQARGVVYRLDPKPGMQVVLTRPELINQYASSIIQATRNHPLGIGAVMERNVLVGDVPFSGFERLPHDQELIVLQSTIEILIKHDLCFREMGLLVFPSQINITRPIPREAHPRTEVVYRFSGSIETIYASLVVRLSYTDYFRREDQWKYAVEFSREGERLGFSMHLVEEGTGELEIYFHPGLSEFDRVTFIRFITDHLRTKGIDIQEEIRLYCPKCGNEISDRNAIEARINERLLDIPCQYCGTATLIPKSIEERYMRDSMLIKKQRELIKTVGKRTEKEIEQFNIDQQQYSQEEDRQIHILHISDLHLENKDQAQVYRTQLEIDLKKELKVKLLEYLVISGDIANHATGDEYKIAFEMLDGLVKHFGLDANRIIIVPGNHDLNWELSKKAYQFIYKEDLPTSLPNGKYIPAGDAGVLLCSDDLYPQRFANFNAEFYKRVYNNEYPLDYTQQAILTELPEDNILFLALNSCWQIDHNFRDRASINMNALARALDNLQDEKYDKWLKIAVWHHPITGIKQPMNDEFMQLLATSGFQVCMHGHIHEAIEGFYKYDQKHSIHIIGVGTFGAPSKEQVAGIPLQYNLITFDPDTSEVTVNTRKKEKPNGVWSADARWDDKNNPKSYYSFNVKR